MMKSIPDILWKLCLVWLLCAHNATSAQVQEIKIASASGRYDELLIQRNNGHYFAQGKEINASLVKKLLSAVTAPVAYRPTLKNLGITPQWLNEMADKAIQENTGNAFENAADNQKELFRASFNNPKLIARQIQEYYFFTIWSDDYPLVEIELVWRNGRKIKVRSEAQHLFMIPWQVGRGTKTYNADIARAVAALMPESFPNRERLNGADLTENLVDRVLTRLEDQWNLLECENKAGRALKSLRTQYVVERAELSPYHGLDFGKEWVGGEATETNLDATLKAPKLSPNFQIGINLHYQNGQVENVTGFLNRVRAYKDLLFSVGWLKMYMAAHPAHIFELRFVGGHSFSTRAMEAYTADMRLSGNGTLAQEVAAVQDKVSLLVVLANNSASWWLVLPDKRVVLWRINGKGALLKWRVRDITFTECSTGNDKCAGAIISADGKLMG